ncbi:hypothetical protein LJC35_00470 [Parabacteroides sp. OttesenSCG-928-N08]|nr:hypothetical protein [Parabacteroides sp. OttesenSCG-928-N08]
MPSTSRIKTRFNLGYPQAGEIMDILEASGVVSGFTGSKARTILGTIQDLTNNQL